MILHEARRQATSTTAPAIFLNLAVVVIGLTVVAGVQALARTRRAPFLRMAPFDPAIHILQFDPRASPRQLPAQVVSHESMIVNVQAEVVIDPARDRAGINLGLRV